VAEAYKVSEEGLRDLYAAGGVGMSEMIEWIAAGDSAYRRIGGRVEQELVAVQVGAD